MAITYIATILDPHHPGDRDTFPGLMYADDGAPIATIRVRYAGEDGAARVSNYLHAGPGDAADHHTYAWESDADWAAADADATAWVIELHPEN